MTFIYKENLKKLLSKKIFYVILALLIIGIIEVGYAATLINSKNVSYSNSSSKLSSNNVQEAIDELYNNCKNVKETCPDGKKCFQINTSSDLIKENVSSENDLYQDSIEKDKYFYRGKNPNNYLLFSGNIYRIININTDGIIRIIAQSSIGGRTFAPADGNESRFSSSSSDYCGYTDSSNYSGCNVWGSKTTMRDSSGNIISKISRQADSSDLYMLPSTEASVNKYLNNTWFNNLSNKNLVIDSTFNVGPVSYTGSTNQSISIDMNQSEKYTWQGKVGLMEITDYPKTNSNQSSCSSVNNNNASQNYSTCKETTWLWENGVYNWTINPTSNPSSNTVWFIDSSGYITNAYAYYNSGVRPVMTLKSGLNLIGTGILILHFKLLTINIKESNI